MDPGVDRRKDFWLSYKKNLEIDGPTFLAPSPAGRFHLTQIRKHSQKQVLFPCEERSEGAKHSNSKAVKEI